MKKLLAIAALLVASAISHAQGTIQFANFNGGSIDAPVFHEVTKGGGRLDGSGFVAQLFVQISGEFQAVGAALPFFSGGGAGYFDSTSDALRTVPGIAPGAQATVQVRAWDLSTGSSWDNAIYRGESTSLTLTLGGAGDPPSVPTALNGLQSFNLYTVPEPSTIALAMLGGAALFLRRRK